MSSRTPFLASAAGRTLVVVLLLAAVGAATYLALTRSARGRFLVASRVTNSRAVATRELGATVRHGLARVAVDAATIAPAAPDRALDSAWVVTLPPRLPLAEANLAITDALGALGGVVWDVIETQAAGSPAVRMTVGTGREPLASVLLVSTATQVVGVPQQRLAIVFLDATPALARQLAPLLAAQTACAIAIAPGTAGADTLARGLAARGAEILLYLPMEAKTGNRNPGDIVVDASSRAIAKVVEDALRAVPGARGVANREGSLALQDEPTMTATLSALQQHGLYFLEIPVTTDSVCRKVGRQLAAAVITADQGLDARFSEMHGVREPMQRVLRDLLPRSHRAILTVRGDSVTYHAALAAMDSLALEGVSVVPLSTLLQ